MRVHKLRKQNLISPKIGAKDLTKNQKNIMLTLLVKICFNH